MRILLPMLTRVLLVQVLLRWPQLLLLPKSLNVLKLLHRSWSKLPRRAIRHIIKWRVLAFEPWVRSSPCIILQITLVLWGNILARPIMVPADRLPMIHLYAVAIL